MEKIEWNIIFNEVKKYMKDIWINGNPDTCLNETNFTIPMINVYADADKGLGCSIKWPNNYQIVPYSRLYEKKKMESLLKFVYHIYGRLNIYILNILVFVLKKIV